MENRVLAEVRNVSKYFKKSSGSLQVLDDVSFEMHENEFLAIVGPSGCGKTTLLRMFAGLIIPSRGMLRIRGKLVSGPIQEMGIVFQTPVLLEWRSIFSNVMLPAEIRHLDKETYRKRASELLKLVGLQGFEGSYPYELSGGMQQRVSLCRALLPDPEFLLMDEPFGALDAITRDRMNTELLRIWEGSGKAVLFITHSVSEAVFLADRVLVMSSRPGRIHSITNIDLPRPRNLSILQSAEFVSLVSRIRNQIQEVAYGPESANGETRGLASIE